MMFHRENPLFGLFHAALPPVTRMREYPSADVLREEMQTVSAIVEQINRTANTLRQSLREHEYFQARGLLGRLAEMPIQVNEIEHVRETINARCSKATALAKRGLLESNNDLPLAEALLRRSLQVCADYSEVEEGLKKLEERCKRVPRLEEQFLDALARGKAAARTTLTNLLRSVTLSSEAQARLYDQVASLEKARTSIRGIMVGAAIAVVVVVIVTAVLMGTRGP
ncbi:MAG: hypothetical protein KAV82_07770 [Phycisphaerae bacterium]|nr:hypothetical protein [Phycisphaerae bacterium]